ncbi:UNVERIFIED_CONTAM: hypothetical protein FKN15_004345 [Acipenser sinensis]
MVTNFIAFICFVTVSGTASYVAATWMEIVISFLFFLLYLLKLNKKLTVFFWPLIALSFICFICFVASSAAAFVTAPLVEFLFAFFLLFAYSSKFNEQFKGFHWPLMDFLRCVSASVIYFIISIIAVSRYIDAASKAAGVFGFIATIVFALDFYVIFNDLANFLKQGDTTEQPNRGRKDLIVRAVAMNIDSLTATSTVL